MVGERYCERVTEVVKPRDTEFGEEKDPFPPLPSPLLSFSEREELVLEFGG